MAQPARQFKLALLDKELSVIEKQVLNCFCTGLTIKEITYNMYKNPEKRINIYYYIQRIKFKLRAKTIEHAIAIYVLQNPELIKQLLLQGK